MKLRLVNPRLRVSESAVPGKRWEIVVIREGYSLNCDDEGRPYFYPSQTIREAAPLFSGAPVAAHRYSDGGVWHLPPEMEQRGLALHVVGWLGEARAEEIPGEGVAIIAPLTFANTLEGLELSKTLSEAWAQGIALLEFSIDAAGSAVLETVGNTTRLTVTEIALVESVDLVTRGAAGGRLLRLVAGALAMNKWQKLIEALRTARPQALVGVDLTGADDQAVRDRLAIAVQADTNRQRLVLREAKPGTRVFREGAVTVAQLEELSRMITEGMVDEALAMIADLAAGMTEEPMEESTEPEPTTEPSPEAAALAEANRRIALIESNQRLDSALASSDLPQLAQARVRKLAERRPMSAPELAKAIGDEKAYLAELRESGQVQNGEITVGDSQLEKYRKAMYAMISSKREIDGVPAFRGLHESYRVIYQTPESPMRMAQQMMQAVALSLPGESGIVAPKWGEDQNYYLREHAKAAQAQAVSLRMAVSTSTWAEIFGDSVTRRLQDVFRTESPDWRRIVSSIVPISDFRTQRRPLLGGFGDLPTVVEGGVYPALTDPGDTEETYAAAKRGGLFNVTLEALANDDLSAIRTIPDRLGRSAARTLGKFVLNTLFSSNPTLVSDSTALFDAAHSNYGTTALSAASLDAAIVRLLKQTELTSGERLGLVRPATLVGPPDLEKTMFELTQSPTDVVTAKNATVPNRFLRYNMEYLVNVWQTDTNNWQLVADTAQVNTIEVGFLDGMEEPALFLADAENVGSRMSADTNTLKIRFIFGGTPLDFRGVDGSVVT